VAAPRSKRIVGAACSYSGMAHGDEIDPSNELWRGCSNPRPTSALVHWIAVPVTVPVRSGGHAHAVDRAPETRSGTEPLFLTKPHVISTGAVYDRDARDAIGRFDGSW
jgi:hypothetical protein